MKNPEQKQAEPRPSTAAHSPAPWIMEIWSPRFAEFAIKSGRDEIALVYASDGRDPDGFASPTQFPSEANARVICAAPELLGSLSLAAFQLEIAATVIEATDKSSAALWRGWATKHQALVAKATNSEPHNTHPLAKATGGGQ